MRFPAMLALATLLAGCGESTGPAGAPGPAAGQVPSLARTARSSGAVIVRFEGNTPEVGLFLYDAETQLLAGLATDNSNFGCVPGTELGHSNDQLVETPAGSTAYLSRVDQVYLTIYNWDGSGGISCALLTGPSAVAFGIVPGVLHSNDIFDAGGHAGTFGMGVRGTITALGDGNPLHVMAHFLDLVTGSGAVKSLATSVELSRDPRE